MPRTVYFCSLDCGRHFKYSAACARHEMNGKCQRATPVALPEPSQKRNRKRTLQEAMDLADEFDASPLGKKRFAKEKGISVGCLRRCYDRREAHKDQPHKLTAKELNSRSMGSGKTKPELRVITAVMSMVLLEYLHQFRGPTPVQHLHHGLEDSWALHEKKTNVRLPVTTSDLVDELKSYHDEVDKTAEFESVTDENWCKRVRTWCKDNDIVPRRFNHKFRSTKNLEVTANRCLGTQKEFDRVYKEGMSVAAMDETSMRIFSMHCTSLHWKGARDVPVSEEATSKVTLSMPVIWHSDGSMELMVLWSDGRNKELQWTQHEGVWWLRAPSKMTRKDTYPEILKFYISRGKKVDVYLDDEARGHGGLFPERFFESLSSPCQRVRVLGTCTSYNQPGDRPQCNKELKRLVRKVMRRRRVRRFLKGQCKLHKSLTLEARIEISKVLSEVRQEFNSNPKNVQGVIRAFQETLLGKKKHSGLATLLEKASVAEYQPYGSVAEYGHACRCGFRLKTENGKHSCWYNRKNLWAPLVTGQEPSDPTCLVFEGHSLTENRTFLGLVVERNTAYALSDDPKLLKGQWWNKYRLKYKQPGTYQELYLEHAESIRTAAQRHSARSQEYLKLCNARVSEGEKTKPGRAAMRKLRKEFSQAEVLAERASHVQAHLS